MNISVISSLPIKQFYLESLDGTRQCVSNHSNVDLEHGWYLLTIHFYGLEVDIQSLFLDHESVGPSLYTGWYETSDGVKHQPCQTSFKPGKWCIWIHSNFGYMKHILHQCLNSFDLGKNLFEEYFFTVDRSVSFSKKAKVRPSVASYFAHGFGPRWWKHQLPYEVLDLDLPENIVEFAEEVTASIPNCVTGSRFDGAVTSRRMQNETTELYDTSIIQHDQFRSLVESAGYHKIFYLNVAEMAPYTDINIHKDIPNSPEHQQQDQLLTRMYITCATQYDGLYFKMGEAGLVPVDKAVRIYPCDHTHAVVNDTPFSRKVIMVQGLYK